MVEQKLVSVVLSVFDKPADVSRTIKSVLTQKNVELELIVVIDGASRAVIDVVESFEDFRLVKIYQSNQGLTKALQKGCDVANGNFIARIDAGDQMSPDRLHKQLNFLCSNSKVAIIGCVVEMVTDEGFPLYHVEFTAEELKRSLMSDNVDEFKSFVHSSVMFRKQAYEHVGGYRSEFYFTQDCDLWARIVWAGYDLGMIDETLQTNVFSTSGISGQHRASQQALEKIIVSMNRLRSLGQSDLDLLSEAAEYRPSSRDLSILSRRADNFEGDYFIASTLSLSSPREALIYWRKALSAKPWSVKALLKASLCWIRALAA